MALGMEMMISSAIKASGFDPEVLKNDLAAFQSAIAQFIADDKQWKKDTTVNLDLLLAGIGSLISYALKTETSLALIEEKVSYSRDPRSIEPDSDASKFAHFSGEEMPTHPIGETFPVATLQQSTFEDMT